jgi:hypothetical protein
VAVRVRLGARIYATTHGCEDRAYALAVKDAIAEKLAQRREAGLITGYEATAIGSDEDWEEQGLDREVIDEVTGGGLPVIYVNITYDADDPRQRDADHSDIVEMFHLLPVLEVTEPDR